MNPSRSLHRIILGIIGATGTAIFAFFFSLTFHTPEWVEDFDAGFIEKEVGERVDTAIDSVQPPAGDSALSRAASALYAKNEERIERYREDLREKVHERMADAIAQARNLDCECRDKWAQWLKDGTSAKIRLLQKANQGITDFIQSNYARVVADLKRDIRIFTSANALVFALLCDIILNRARITTEIVNTVLEAVGSVSSAVPC